VTTTAGPLLEPPPARLDVPDAPAVPVAPPRDRTAWALGLVLAAGVGLLGVGLGLRRLSRPSEAA